MFNMAYSKEINDKMGTGKRRTLLLVALLFSSIALFNGKEAPVGVSDGAIARPAPAAVSARAKPAPAIAEKNDVPTLGAIEARASEYISKNYRIARDASDKIVFHTFSSSKKRNVDPLVMLSIMAVESAFNPISESFAGAKGLTQALPRAHPEKMASLGKGHILNISDNIDLGARIFAEYLNKYDGNETTALQQYNGSLFDKSRAYSKKVLSVKARIKGFVAEARG